MVYINHNCIRCVGYKNRDFVQSSFKYHFFINFFFPYIITDVKEKTMPKCITDNIEISFDDSDAENFEEENSNGKNSNEENQIYLKLLYNALSFYIFNVSNDSPLYIAKKVNIFKVNHVHLSDFESF